VCSPIAHLPPALLPDSGIALARDVSQNAQVDESDFHVGCLLQSDSNTGILGVNVEHPDWNRILCAERNAIGTAVTFGLGDLKNVYVSAPKDDNASPCGACRQVLVELAQRAMVWMDRGKNPAMGEPCDQLLPYYFSGHTIQKPNPLPKR
jgi:homotetrameric cytidine deaminase